MPPWTNDHPHMQISALRISPTVPHHISTVSIPHFTFRIPHSAVPHFTHQTVTCADETIT